MANDKILFETPGIDWVELEGQELYSADEKAKMIEEYVSTVKTVEKNQIISGTVVGKTDKDVVLNIGFKSDGLVGLTEFRGDGDLEIGSEVEVFVVTEEDKKVNLYYQERTLS